MPFFVNEFSRLKIQNAQLQHIENRIENIGSPDFFPFRGEIYTAVRTGIFLEDFSKLLKTGGEEELKVKITQMLGRELERLSDRENSFLQELIHLKKKNYPALVQRIRELMEKQSLIELFRFGRFIGQSILVTFENQNPKQEDIEKYREIAEKYKLPPGVFKRLDKLETTTGIKVNREILKEIEEIFFK